jgi:glutathionyl-hydroquinone reductase
LRGVFGWPGADADLYNDGLKTLKESAKTINTFLQGKEYLVGSTVTVADIVLF